MRTQTRPPHRGMVNLGTHREYMAAIDREDERLASIIESIVTPADTGELITGRLPWRGSMPSNHMGS